MGAVRLFLALVVVIDHWRAVILQPMLGVDLTADQERFVKLGFNGGYAVLFFYMISGFLITYTLTANYEDNVAGSLKFYRNRVIRIFSVYWPMIVLSFIVYPPGLSEFVGAAIADKFTNLFLLGVDWRVAFATYPTAHFAAAPFLLHQAWTLGAELGFYLLAPLIVRSWKITAVLLAGSLALRLWFVATLGYDEVWTYYFAPSTFVFFMIGALACQAARYISILTSRTLGLPLLACCTIVMASGPFGAFDSPRLWVPALCFGVALPGLFAATKDMRVLNLLGDLSYPVYLVHSIVLQGIWKNLISLATSSFPENKAWAGDASIVMFVGAVIVASIVVHWLIERPMAKIMHVVLRS
jgi:peptidoglycan/LPS O-acetylase OafA/YrhL